MEKLIAKNNQGMTLRRCGRYLWVFNGTQYFKRVESVTEGMAVLGLASFAFGVLVALVLALGGLQVGAGIAVLCAFLCLVFDQEDVNNQLTSRQRVGNIRRLR